MKALVKKQAEEGRAASSNFGQGGNLLGKPL